MGVPSKPDKMILKLSDAYVNQEIEASLELTVQMININSDYNQELKKKSEALYGYSLYISKVREYNDDGMSVKEAAIKALDYCIDNDILADFFKERRNEVVGMILEEYTKEHVEQRTARKLEKMSKELQDKDAVIQSKDAEIQAMTMEIAHLHQLLEEKHNQI